MEWVWGEDKEFIGGHAKFELPIRHSSGDFEMYIWGTVFKAMRLEEFTSRVSVD